MKQLLILFCFFVCQVAAAQNADPIQEAMANYDYETAINLINKEKPTASLLLLKAKAQKGLNRYGEALATYKEVLAQDAENIRVLIDMADCYKSSANYHEAVKCYEQVLLKSPENKYVQFQYISLLCGLERFEKAQEKCNALLANDSSAVSLHLQAQCLEGLNHLISAVSYYHIIQDKYPNDYLSAAKLGSLYIEMKEYPKAIESTEKYRQRDSTNLIVNRQNAMAYCLEKDYSNAVQRYDALLAQGDSTYLTCYYAGVSNYAKEDYYKAHDLLEFAHQYEPQNVNLLYYLARTCAKTSWKKEGVEYIEKAIDLTIPSDDVLLNLYRGATDCYKMAAMYDKQIETMKLQYKYEPNRHKHLYDIAFVYSNFLKDTKNTERYLEAFLKTKPQEAKKEESKVNADGSVELGVKNYYNAATKWLNDIRKEKFFKEGTAEKK